MIFLLSARVFATCKILFRIILSTSAVVVKVGGIGYNIYRSDLSLVQVSRPAHSLLGNVWFISVCKIMDIGVRMIRDLSSGLAPMVSWGLA